MTKRASGPGFKIFIMKVPAGPRPVSVVRKDLHHKTQILDNQSYSPFEAVTRVQIPDRAL